MSRTLLVLEKIECVQDGGARFANTLCGTFSIRETSLTEGPAWEPFVLGGVSSLFRDWLEIY